MPIKDLLWACPLCFQIESLDRDGRCRHCGAAFRRGRGARIRVAAGETNLELSPVEWLSRLPWPDLDGEGRDLPAGMQPPFSALAQVRTAVSELPLRRGADLLGFVERFGPATDVRLTLSADALSAVPEGSAGGNSWRWALTDITAIQPSSSAIQLKAKGEPAISIRFPDSSVRLWEQRLQYCVRAAWAGAGKGQVSEFQPCIRVR